MVSRSCWFREYLNLYCPGCGGTRMIKSILKFEFYQAFRYNPLLFILLILGTFLVIINVILKISKKSLIIPREREWVILAGVIIIYFVLRNISLFDFLLPTKV